MKACRLELKNIGAKMDFYLFFFLFLLTIMCFDLHRYLSWCFEVVNKVSAFSACAAAEKHLSVKCSPTGLIMLQIKSKQLDRRQ